MLPTRTLATQGLEVSAVGLGCMGMSQSYDVPDDRESIAIIRRALDLGVTSFDAAEVYGPFTNERLLGGALKGRRDVVDASLGLDRIDLLHQHRIDPAVPIEEVVGTVARLIAAGKLRFIGLSEAGAANVRRAHATYPVSLLQCECSLRERAAMRFATPSTPAAHSPTFALVVMPTPSVPMTRKPGCGAKQVPANLPTFIKE